MVRNDGKLYSLIWAKRIALASCAVRADATHALNKLSDGLLDKYINGNKAEKEDVKADFEKAISEVFYAYETEAHMALIASFSERFQGTAKELCTQFINDFSCKTNVEKALAETAALAFMRQLDASRRLNNCFDVDTYITPNKTAYQAMLSKERDRAHRQFLATVSMIKQLKTPAVEMNIRAKTAFVAQNQQINADKQHHEHNDPK
ncbi:MAG: hypothetical protein KGI71_03765 [Patescibacteria group bacterium]|nr:hypothetical protein [Patescibacteria group bacterium]